MSLHPARPKSASATNGTAIAGRCLGSDGNQHTGPAFRVGIPVASSIEPREDMMASIPPAAVNIGRLSARSRRAPAAVPRARAAKAPPAVRQRMLSSDRRGSTPSPRLASANRLKLPREPRPS